MLPDNKIVPGMNSEYCNYIHFNNRLCPDLNSSIDASSETPSHRTHIVNNFLNKKKGSMALTDNGPIYYREDPQCSINYTDEPTFLTWSIFSTILFLPLWFIWVPAVLASKISKNKFMDGNYFEGKKYAKASLGLNISCTIVGLISYGITALLVLYYLVSLETPLPPLVGRVTHYNVYLEWSHVKDVLPAGNTKKYRYKIQEISNTKKDWTTVYTGYGVCTTVCGLEPQTEYSYRLIISGPGNVKSNYSSPVTVRTTKEPVNCDLFHRAVFFDKRTEIETFLTEGTNKQNLFEIPDKLGNTALMIAVIRDHVDLIELFIEHGADVNYQNESLKTALMLAAFHGKLSMVKTLRQHGASYSIRDNMGMSAIHYAVDGGHCDTLELMITDGADVNDIETTNGWTPLLRAAAMNSDENVAKVLCKYGAHLNVEDINERSALMIATINGNLPFVQVLVYSGADIYALNSDGKTLYDLALSMDRRSILKFFDDHAEQKKVEYRRSRPSIISFDPKDLRF